MAVPFPHISSSFLNHQDTCMSKEGRLTLNTLPGWPPHSYPMLQSHISLSIHCLGGLPTHTQCSNPTSHSQYTAWVASPFIPNAPIPHLTLNTLPGWPPHSYPMLQSHVSLPIHCLGGLPTHTQCSNPTSHSQYTAWVASPLIPNAPIPRLTLTKGLPTHTQYSNPTSHSQYTAWVASPLIPNTPIPHLTLNTLPGWPPHSYPMLQSHISLSIHCLAGLPTHTQCSNPTSHSQYTAWVASPLIPNAPIPRLTLSILPKTSALLPNALSPTKDHCSREGTTCHLYTAWPRPSPTASVFTGLVPNTPIPGPGPTD